jgi:hypothetical protein
MRHHPLSLSVLLMAGSVSLFAGIDSNLLNLIPGGTRVVGGIQVNQARSSSFGQYLLSQINTMSTNDQDFQQFIQLTGFDPRQDVQQILAVGNGDRGSPKFAILAEATFDKARFLSLAQNKGETIQSFQGVDMILHGKRANAGMAFLDAGLIAAGDVATLQQIIAGRAIPSSADPTLLSQIQKVNDKNDAWFVSIVTGSDFIGQTVPGAGSANQAQILKSILLSSGGVQFGDRVAITVDTVAASPQDATSLTDVVRFLAGMVQTNRKNADPRTAILATAIDNMALTTSGANTHVGISFAEKDLEQLAESMPKGHPQAPAR